MKAPAFDLSPAKDSNGPAGPPSSSPAPARKSAAASPSRNGPVKQEVANVEDIEEEDQGFDLTRGFQSIGSYHAPAANGVAVVGAVSGRS